MKKLLIATDNYLPRHDGISRVLSEIIPRLKTKYAITIIAPAFNNTKTQTVDGIEIVRIPLRKHMVGDYQPAKFKSKIIKHYVHEADIVFAQTLAPIGAIAIYQAQKQKKKVVAFVHSVEWELVPMAMRNYFRKLAYPLSKAYARFFYGKCDLILFPAQSIQDNVSWEVPSVEKRIVHLGCDTNTFVPPKSKVEAKKALGFDPKAIVIGYHGRLCREKDLKTLLRGFIKVDRKHKKKLLIVGDGIDSIKKMLERPNIHLHGSVDDVVPFLQAMDIYALSSLTETTCLSILEAMSCEVSVVTTRVGFVKDYIQEGKNGLFFDFQNNYELAKKLEQLIDNPVQMRSLGKRARETVIKLFDWNKTVKELIDAFESLEED
ncbi:MAG: glycosyltransferase family 4 protein [Nanoarchaeota archaeon]|nr:glycosyltransferase family 4 protein [Nanoarchaeota archaeon]